MNQRFSKNIAPFVKQELTAACHASAVNNAQQAFAHLERAHVLGQESTYWHVKVHCLMLLWACRHRSAREALGQVFRIIGAATKTAFGWVPQGNTGGANVSPFRKMPIEPELAEVIQKARVGL